MFRNFFLLVILTLFSISCKKQTDKNAERNAVVDSTVSVFQQKIYQSALDSVFQKYKFNGSVAVFRDSTLVYEKQNGFENFKQKTKLSPETVFAIGSLSKQFTAVLILMQQEAGKLNVTDKVSKYLPEFEKAPFSEITIHQLLNHTSGLNDFGGNLLSQPGKEFNYSNKGFRYLGKIIEKTSGKSYDENATALFQKLGMKHTATAGLFRGTHFGGANTGTEKNAQSVENMPQRLAADAISVPAGGLLSTIGDLNIWNEALFGGKILNAENLKKMITTYTQRPHYVLGTVGYGYGIMMNLKKPEAYFHTGYVKGSPSLNIYYPETKTSVIILSNIANEAIGKDEFFRPHAEVKKEADLVENAVTDVRKEMIKTVR